MSRLTYSVSCQNCLYNVKTFESAKKHKIIHVEFSELNRTMKLNAVAQNNSMISKQLQTYK